MAVDTGTLAARPTAQTQTPLVGVWVLEEEYQITEYLFRADGRYQFDTKSTNPDLKYRLMEQGVYSTTSERLTLTCDEYFGERESRQYGFRLDGRRLSISALGFEHTQVYVLRGGSREDVLARQAVDSTVIGTWSRSLPYSGREEYTFRPGGYFVRKTTSDGGQPPELLRGRYEQQGSRLTLQPYGGVETQRDLDFFGATVTLIRRQEFSGDSLTYDEVARSESVVRAKSAEADAFLARPDWHVGTWQVRDGTHIVDLTFRPDGCYVAEEKSEYLAGIVRGRYRLESRRIHLQPFVGQGLYAKSNGEFGKVERTRELDYYDGELQFIDLEALSQSVTLARKRTGSDSSVVTKTRAAQAQRARADWQIGVWQVNDPAGWMEFTFRPDGRYVAKAGADGVPREVERGEYSLGADIMTLTPYAGQGPARSFTFDLYDGDLFLIGALDRMVVARQVARSRDSVIRNTRDPEAMKGERGSILGLWTADLPGESTALVFRPDGEFRLRRCAGNIASDDYGLYAVDMATRALVSDSRFMERQPYKLDFYGNTMTIHGGTSGPPRTFIVNRGKADAAIAGSHAADAAASRIDAEWLARVPIGPRRPDAMQMSTADIPADPRPERIFQNPDVFTGFHLYRRLIPGFAYFNVQGTIRTVPVMNSREFYVFPTGRILIRFRNYRAGSVYPNTITDISDSWGAYRIEPKPEQRDVLRRYADNVFMVETDIGETIAMTLEDGRRHLFWGRDHQILSEWAADQKPIGCEGPAAPDPSLLNTGVSLTTTIAPA